MKPYHITIASVFFVLAGIVLCYLAFSFVRDVAWILITHMGGIACILAAGIAVWIFVKRRT